MTDRERLKRYLEKEEQAKKRCEQKGHDSLDAYIREKYPNYPVDWPVERIWHVCPGCKRPLEQMSNAEREKYFKAGRCCE